MINLLQPVLNDLGSASSIIALILTICVLFSVNRITSHFLFKARAPMLLKDIGKHAKQLNELLVTQQAFESNRNQVHVILSEAQITVTHLLPRLRKDIRIRTKRIVKMINKMRGRIATASHSEVYEIYSSLRALETDLKNEIEDAKWSQNHDR